MVPLGAVHRGDFAPLLELAWTKPTTTTGKNTRVDPLNAVE